MHSCNSSCSNGCQGLKSPKLGLVAKSHTLDLVSAISARYLIFIPNGCIWHTMPDLLRGSVWCSQTCTSPILPAQCIKTKSTKSSQLHGPGSDRYHKEPPALCHTKCMDDSALRYSKLPCIYLVRILCMLLQNTTPYISVAKQLC